MLEGGTWKGDGTMAAAQRRMNARQEAFCQEYLLDLNGAAAARRAGYSARSANRIARENLSKHDIAARISVFMKERAERTRISTDRIVTELAKIAFASVGDLVTITAQGHPEIDLSRASDDVLAALAQIRSETKHRGRGHNGYLVKKTRLKMHDKVQALYLLGRHLGMFGKDLQR